VPAQTLTPVSAAAFGPGGGQGDNPQLAHLAIDGNRTTGWHTDWYTSARFGNLHPGTGLLLNMGRTVTISSVRINLGRVSGASFQLRVGAGPSLTDLPLVARRQCGRRGPASAHLAGARPLRAPVVHQAAGRSGRHLPGGRL
jgi:hypothetical protein